jgi:translation initiation factor 2 subunit 2
VLNYTYEELISRIFGFINSSRPEEKAVYKMKPPVVYREGTKRTVWVNFPEICQIMGRLPEHVLAFVLAEVGSTGSIDGNGRLVIKGKFQPKHIENILRRYIAEYVKCQTCKSPETNLKKENRLLFLICEKCGSTRSVTVIKQGFQATTRAARRADKEGRT